MSATNQIGTAAGKVWKFLDKNGPSSLSKIVENTGLPKNDAHRAIGWLAKEDKLIIEAKGRIETLSLK
jgi:DNA-binding IclR family transcriptional regulator